MHHHPHLPSPHTLADASTETQAKNRLKRLASYAAVTVATLLLMGKTAAWWQTESLAMLSSLTDSFFDLIASFVNLLALRYAMKPADEDHSFGHNAIEDLAGLAQSAFIVASMTMIILQSVERLFNPHPVSHAMMGMGMSALAMLATLGLVAFQTHVAKRTGSLIVASDRLHYVGDVLFNFGVLAAFAISSATGWQWVDPAMAIGIACVVLWSSREIGLRAYHNLMDREMPPHDKARILAIVEASPRVLGYHNLKTRCSGTKPFIQMHVDLSATLGFREAHDIADGLEKALGAAFPEADVIIHIDPR